MGSRLPVIQITRESLQLNWICLQTTYHGPRKVYEISGIFNRVLGRSHGAVMVWQVFFFALTRQLLLLALCF